MLCLIKIKNFTHIGTIHEIKCFSTSNKYQYMPGSILVFAKLATKFTLAIIGRYI